MASLERLTAKHGALLVVDVQEKLMPLIGYRELVVANSVRLVKAAEAVGMPVFAGVLRLYEWVVPDLDASTAWPAIALALAPFMVFPLHDIDARCVL